MLNNIPFIGGVPTRAKRYNSDTNRYGVECRVSEMRKPMLVVSKNTPFPATDSMFANGKRANAYNVSGKTATGSS